MALWSSHSRDVRAIVGSPLRVALKHVLAGDLASAEAVLAAAVREDSSSADLYLALANVYRRRGEIGRAIHVHQNLLLRPELCDELRREALLGLALDFRSGGFLKRATAAFLELLEELPGELQALRALESIYVEGGNWLEAIAVRKRIGSADPRTPTIRAHLWAGLMREYRARGQIGEARKAFRRAVAADRRCAEPYLVMGDIRMDEGKPKKAIDLWRRALPLESRAAGVLYIRLSRAFEVVSDADGFWRFMQERRAAAPDDPEVRLWWARAALRTGAVERAIAELRQLVLDEPDCYPAYAEVGRALLRAGREPEAVKAFELLLEHLPTTTPLYGCRSCGGKDSMLRWRCPQCGAWDSFS